MPTYGDSILGNFLSGMETGIRGDDRVPLRALETSLVEWKLPFGGREQGRGDALETSLVEWKPGAIPGSPFAFALPWKLP